MRGRGCLSARGNRGDNREEERAYQHQEMAGIDDGDSGGGGGGRFRGIEDFHTAGILHIYHCNGGPLHEYHSYNAM
jgi:hypothetical protein